MQKQKQKKKPKNARFKRITTLKRSLDFIRERGDYAQSVQVYNQYDRKRHDLFGFVDIIAVDSIGVMYCVQSTSVSGKAEHIQKIQENEIARAIASLTPVQLHCWRKIKKKTKEGSYGKCYVWKPQILYLEYDSGEGWRVTDMDCP